MMETKKKGSDSGQTNQAFSQSENEEYEKNEHLKKEMTITTFL